MERKKRSRLDEILLENIERQDLACCEDTLKAGADPNCDVHSDGHVMLTHALDKWFTHGATLLLENGALCGAKSQSHFVPLSAAARNASPVVTRKLLERGAVVDEVTSVDPLTPLQVAAIDAETEVCQLLIDAGADVHAGTHTGKTPLHYAARSLGDSLGTCRVLVAAGADIHVPSVPHPAAVDQRGYSPLEEAVIAGYLGNVRFFIDECGALADHPLERAEALLELASAPKVLEYLRSVIASCGVEHTLASALDCFPPEESHASTKKPDFGMI